MTLLPTHELIHRRPAAAHWQFHVSALLPVRSRQPAALMRVQETLLEPNFLTMQVSQSEHIILSPPHLLVSLACLGSHWVEGVPYAQTRVCPLLM